MNIAELVQLAESHRLQHQHALLEVLDSLRTIDPGVTEQVIRVFGERARAANWLINPVRSLGGVIPLRALAEGKREDVLRVLGQILHGVYA